MVVFPCGAADDFSKAGRGEQIEVQNDLVVVRVSLHIKGLCAGGIVRYKNWFVVHLRDDGFVRAAEVLAPSELGGQFGVLRVVFDFGVYFGKFDVSAYEMINKVAIAANGAPGAPYDTVAEPMIWKKTNGDLVCMIRVVDTDPTPDVDVCYYVIGNSAGSSWGSPIWAGQDFYEHNALMRAFVFQGNCWWQGRHSLPGPALGPPVDWSTFIAKSDLDPDSNNLIPISAEAWWPSYGEGGNGDVDAKSVGGGHLYLDYVSNMYGMAWFVRLFTGVIIRKRIHITHV